MTVKKSPTLAYIGKCQAMPLVSRWLERTPMIDMRDKWAGTAGFPGRFAS